MQIFVVVLNFLFKLRTLIFKLILKVINPLSSLKKNYNRDVILVDN